MQGGLREHAAPFRSTQCVLGALALLTLPGLVSRTAVAQAIQGQVIDAANRSPIFGTAVQLQGDRGNVVARATSDSSGRFFLTLSRPGLYSLSASRLGYLQHTGDTVRVGESETVSVEVRLDRTALPLLPVVVVARTSGLPEGFEARRATGFGRFITRQDIENRRASSTSDLLRGMPGVVLAPQRRGGGSTLLMRGSLGLCQPAIWIDGMYVAPFAGLSIDNMLTPMVIEAAEVYNSNAAAPSQYRTGTCGVVLFWTRRGGGEERVRTRWWKVALGASAAVGLMLLIK